MTKRFALGLWMTLAATWGCAGRSMTAPVPRAPAARSVGTPQAGKLVNGVQMPRGEHWELMDPGAAYGTEETVESLELAILSVHQEMPGGPRLHIGHISAPKGGPLKPHKSHQSGRDVDIDYFYTGDNEMRWQVATAKNLDRPRTWIFVRTLLDETNVEHIFMDYSVQDLLKRYAMSIGEEPEWLDLIFQVGHEPGTIPVIIHESGHKEHMHVRFFNPVAQQLGRNHRR
jgi:murein endopeptidase